MLTAEELNREKMLSQYIKLDKMNQAICQFPNVVHIDILPITELLISTSDLYQAIRPAYYYS